MSKPFTNFYDFATYFKHAGVKMLSGLMSPFHKHTCPPKNWDQMGGNFGVIIGETAAK
jgi:hypothetical protein